jgi:tRNA (guanosine-2'-O-)-methyltransferase
MTPERLERILTTLNRRQPDLTVITDEVYKPHNLSAIVRTCDAFAIPDVHCVWASEQSRLQTGTAAGSDSWVQVNTHPNISQAIDRMQSDGMKVCVAHFSDRAMDFRDYDYTQPTALLMGAEKVGVSAAASEAADEHLIIPMLGMVQSFNVSVAAAIILSEAVRQREAAGMFDVSRMDKSRYNKLLFEWARPIETRLCQKYQVPYPALREDGEIADPQAFSELINSFSN